MSVLVSVVTIDISSGFSVLEDHSKSRLQPDGYPCNQSSNSICSITERHVLCLPACHENKNSTDAHVTPRHRKSHNW